MNRAHFVSSDQRFGEVVTISISRVRGRNFWLCRCDCGKITTIREDHLYAGVSQSCGCKNSRLAMVRNRKHGHCRRVVPKTSEYHTWASMIGRCTRPSDPVYFRYGGRGIRVCKRWMAFENFIADMGVKPSPDLTIERDDNDGNYEPENCRWATRKEQCNNRRTSHFIEHGSRRLTAAQWGEETGIDSMTLLARLRRGWSEEKTITTPLRQCLK